MTILIVWLITVLGGGSARADVIFLVPVRLAAIIGTVVLLLLIPKERLRLQRAPLLFAGLAASIIALELIPLPPSIWTSLPGREPYAALSGIADLGAVWRPFTLSPDLTWNALLSLIPPLFFLIAIPVLGRRARNWILMGLLVTILASGFLGLLQVAGGTESPLRYYPISNNTSGIGFFANRNHEAVFLAMGIPLSIWWALKEDAGPRPGRLALAGASILFLLTAALTTQSRTGSLIVLASVVLTAVFALRQNRAGRRGILWIGGSMVVAAALAGVAFTTWAANRQTIEDATGDLRIAILPESIEAMKTFFPVGAGFGAFVDVFPRFESADDLGPNYVNHTHSEVTQIMIEGGVVSVFLLLLVVLWLARAIWRAWRPGESRGSLSAEARLCTILMTFPLVASITDYPLRTPLMASAFAVIAVLLSSAPEMARRRP